jgi:phage shock protein C
MRRRPRLTRSLIDRVFGGVCGGLGSYLAINTWWVRALFVLLTVATFGFSIIVYVVLWFVLPEQTLTDIALMEDERRTRPETLILIGTGVILTGVIVLALNLGVFDEIGLESLLPFAIILVGLTLLAQQLRRLAA